MGKWGNVDNLALLQMKFMIYEITTHKMDENKSKNLKILKKFTLWQAQWGE